MRDILITLLVFGALPFALMRPYVGILLWSWLAYMNPHRLSYGFAYNFPFSMIVGITLLASLVFNREPKKLPLTPVTICLILFCVWMSITTAFAVFPEYAEAQLTKVLKIQFVTFLTMVIMMSKERLTQLVWVIFLSIGYFAVKGGIFTILTAGSARVWGPAETFIQDNNALALASLMLVPLANYLKSTVENKWIKWGLVAAMFLIIVSAAGSQSRGAYLAGSVMGLYFWWKSKKKFVIGIVGVALFAGIVSFMPQSWHDRMSTIETYDEDASAMGRINAWWLAFNLANDRVTGGGFELWSGRMFAQYAPDPDDVHDAHSIYFEVLGEHGYIGLILFLLIGALSLNNGRWIVNKTAKIAELEWANQLARMVQVSLVCFATGGAFLGLAYYDLYYHLVAMLVITRVLVERHLADSGAGTSESEQKSTVSDNVNAVTDVAANKSRLGLPGR